MADVMSHIESASSPPFWADGDQLAEALRSLTLPALAAIGARAALRRLPIVAESLEAHHPWPLITGNAFVEQRNWLQRLPGCWTLVTTGNSRSEHVIRFYRHEFFATAFRSVQLTLYINWLTATEPPQAAFDRGQYFAACATRATIGTAEFLPLPLIDDFPMSIVHPFSAPVKAASEAAGRQDNHDLIGIKAELVANLSKESEDPLRAAALRADIAHFATTTGSEGLQVEAQRIAILLATPLWHGPPTADVEAAWQRLRSELFAARAGFDVWASWYDTVLKGELDFALQRKFSEAFETWSNVDAEHVNRHLTKLIEGQTPGPPSQRRVAATQRRKKQIAAWRALEDRHQSKRYDELDHLAEQYGIRRPWRRAARALFRPGSLLALGLATNAGLSLLLRHELFNAPGWMFSGAQRIYSMARDALYLPIDAPLSIVGLTVPVPLKDLSFLYFYVGGAVVWTLQVMFYDSAGLFDLVRQRKWSVLVALTRARLFWPLDFFAFWRKWRDPQDVYREVRPEIFAIIRASGFYRFFREFVPPLTTFTLAISTLVASIALTLRWLS